jgi:Tol biopolymer transport system component
MKRLDGLERDLTAWFAEATSPRDPELTEDVLWVTARTRQRPRWSFTDRWVPSSVLSLGRRTLSPVPWRMVALLALLVILTVAAVAVYVGSRPRLPAPYGLAAPGLVAYAQNGDIFAVDPITGIREALAIGPDDDTEPRWSLDGTRVAFLRGRATPDTGVSRTSIVIVDAGTQDVVAVSPALTGIDTDTVAWAPDGRSLTVGGQLEQSLPRLNLVDAGTGKLTPLAVDYAGLDVHWRPPDGHQLLFLGTSGTDSALFVVDVVDGSVTKVASPGVQSGVLRPSGWTPDGRRVIYTTQDVAEGPLRTHVVEIATGAQVIIDAAFAHVSNDGRRIVAIDDYDRMCVADIGGGPCRRIGVPGQAYGSTTAAGVHWSPDDAWILSRSQDTIGESYLVDPDPEAVPGVQPSWLDDGGESWQRTAP